MGNKNCYFGLNFFKINKNLNNKLFLIYIKNILLYKKFWWKLLLIIDKWPFFWVKFINMIILFYAHILKIDVTILYWWSKSDYIDSGINSSDLLTKILQYKWNYRVYYDYDVTCLNNSYDIAIFNIELWLYNLEILDKIHWVKAKKKVYFWYLSNYIKEILLKTFGNMQFIFRHEMGYWFFSKILNDMYKQNIEQDNKKYDLFIAWSIKGRDFELIKYLINKKSDLKICIVISLNEEIEKIKLIIENVSNIDFFHNPNSYSQFLELAYNSKIILNNINTWEWTDQWYWSTGLLPIMWWAHLILSKKTKFYEKYITEWIDWFFYNDYEDCLKKINYILSLDKNVIETIMKNRLQNFNNNEQIEDYCEQIFDLK